MINERREIMIWLRKNGQKRKQNLTLLGVLFLTLILALSGCGPSKTVSRPDKSSAEEKSASEESSGSDHSLTVQKGTPCVGKEEVALYLHLYHELPPNYLTKKEARSKGWSVENPQGKVIGGDPFGNREGHLPKKKGRKYFEADDSSGYGKDRGPRRFVFSNDGLIYYSKDHYQSFELLYGE